MQPTQQEAEILRLASAFAGVAPSNQHWAEFDAYIVSLAEGGLTRGDIWHLITNVTRRHRSSLAPESFDALTDYLTRLVGDCARECVVRLPGEPTDPVEFFDYVFGRSWLPGWKEYVAEVRPIAEAYQQNKITVEEFSRQVWALHTKHNLWK